MKVNIFRAIIITSLFMLVFASSAPAKELRLLSSFGENFIFTTGACSIMMENLSKISAGNMTVKFSGPDVIPTMEQFQPLQAGIFDILFTHPTYHAGTIGVPAAIDAIVPDPKKRRENGIFDYLDKQYSQLGVKLISIPPIATYQFITRVPLDGNKPSFKGLKLRGNPSVNNMIQSLGGAPVSMSGGEVYTGLQKGVIDGAAWLTVGVKDFKWQEVANYLVRPTFSYISLMVLMNLDKYNALPQEQKHWIDEAGRQTEIDSLAHYKNLGDIEIAELIKGGMKKTSMHPDDAKMAEKFWNDGLWEMAIKKSGEKATKFKELALSHGMTE